MVVPFTHLSRKQFVWPSRFLLLITIGAALVTYCESHRRISLRLASTKYSMVLASSCLLRALDRLVWWYNAGIQRKHHPGPLCIRFRRLDVETPTSLRQRTTSTLTPAQTAPSAPTGAASLEACRPFGALTTLQTVLSLLMMRRLCAPAPGNMEVYAL